jgi:hypothetical protein
MSYSCAGATDLRHHSAFFSRSVESEPARWLTIVTSTSNNNNSSQHDCLSRLFGLSYDKMYLPLMVKCGLISSVKSNRYKTVSMVPSIERTVANNHYTWDDFISEHRINIEISYIVDSRGKKVYFIRCGSFEQGSSRFTIQDQIRASMKFKYNTLRDRQRELIALLGDDSLSLFISSNTSPSSATNDTGLDSSVNSNSNSGSYYDETPHCCETLSNMKRVIQTHFFEKILKPGVDVQKMWSYIDEKKLLSGVKELIAAVHKAMHEIETSKLLPLNNSANITMIHEDISKYPSIKKFGVPMVNTVMKSLLRDIVSLNEKTSENLLTFQMFNGKFYHLVHPICSTSY